MMIINDFGEKKFLVKKIFFGLVFKLKFFITISMSWTNFDKNLKQSRSGRLKYCSGVVRSLGKGFFDPKYHPEMISWPCVQIISTQTKKLCPPHILERFGSRVFTCQHCQHVYVAAPSYDERKTGCFEMLSVKVYIKNLFHLLIVPSLQTCRQCRHI